MSVRIMRALRRQKCCVPRLKYKKQEPVLLWESGNRCGCSFGSANAGYAYLTKVQQQLRSPNTMGVSVRTLFRGCSILCALSGRLLHVSGRMVQARTSTWYRADPTRLRASFLDTKSPERWVRPLSVFPFFPGFGFAQIRHFFFPSASCLCAGGGGGARRGVHARRRRGLGAIQHRLRPMRSVQAREHLSLRPPTSQRWLCC